MLKTLFKFNNISMKKKFIISNIFVVFLPLMFVGIMLTHTMRNMAINNAIKESETNVDRIETRINQIMSIPTSISDSLVDDNQLYDIVNKDYQSAKEIFDAYSNYNQFDNYLKSYNRMLKGVYFYPFNPQLFENWRFMKIDSVIRKSDWYIKALDDDGVIRWNYLYDKTQRKYYLSLVRLLKYSSQDIGVFVVTLDKSYLYSVVENEPFETIVINEKGTIVLSTNKNKEGRNIKQFKFSKDILKSKNKTIDVDYNNEPSKVIMRSFQPNEETPSRFKVITIFPLKNITASAKNASTIGFVVILTSFLLSLILIVLFSTAHSRRISKLSNYLKKVFNEDFNVDVASNISGNDEIGQLASDIDTMVRHMRTLVYEVYEMDLQQKQLVINQKDIQLKMLASQINPHFLYNALETIRMKAHCRGEKEIAHIVKQFAKIMRRNLEVSNNVVSIESELDIVNCYLEIQKFRFGDKINYEINVKSDVKDNTILPLIIQPLVENAFVHGLENKEDCGKIIIEVEKLDDTIVITIKDNGIGIEEKRLKELQEGLKEGLKEVKSTKNNRIGLNNVYKRIKLHYGEKYGLTINSVQNEETIIKILIPAAKEVKSVQSINY